MSHNWEILAVRFAEWETVKRDHYYRYSVYGDPDGPLHMDYYFWVLQNGSDTVLVDTGFHPDALSNRPGRTVLVPPMEALGVLDIAPHEVSNIIVTHLHYDHSGNLHSFPNARFHVQRKELDFWTGPYGRRPAAAASTEWGEISFLQQAHVDGRVELLDGDSEILPGISTKLAPGHCPGQQIVVVENDDPVVLASDAMHFYDEVHLDRPFEVFFDLEKSYQTYDMLRSLENGGATLVAGHDPEVATLFEPITAKNPSLGVRIN